MSKILMYTKNLCPYCSMAQRLLASKGVEWDEVNIESGPGLRDEMVDRTGRITVPQIYIGDTHVGGFDDLVALERAGRLDPLLAGSPE
jgi:glutaredoxin 3